MRKIGACSSDDGGERRRGIELRNNRNRSGDESQTIGGNFRMRGEGGHRGLKEKGNIEGASLG